MKRKFVVTLTLVALMLFSVVGATFAQDFEPNIMDIAAADDRFDTLEAAIKAANLADTLASADASFTVFAPTDAAFAALPAGLVDSLLADPDGALTQVLLYHVAAGELTSGDVLGRDSITTLQGSALDVNLRGNSPFVNDSQIIITDIQAKNGIIHVIDAVLVPPVDLPSTPAPAPAPEAPSATIAEIAAADGRFDTLLAALTAADLATTFTQPGNYTVFAPTDDAFAAIPADRLAELLADPQGELKSILLYHVVGDQLTRDQIATDNLIPTLDGRPIIVNRDGSTIIDVSGAQILISDIQASNGIIHVIDAVMIP